jgi:hypothetical protein
MGWGAVCPFAGVHGTGREDQEADGKQWQTQTGIFHRRMIKEMSHRI